MEVRVQQAAFDAGAELQAFSEAAALAGAGAVVSFTGIVRDTADASLLRMEIEHYPGMTERAIGAFCSEACQRWRLSAALVIHRYGALGPREPIMMVATAALHRAEAFAAADFLMDYLKSRAPFWKKEITAGGAAWVHSRAADEEALSRWQGTAVSVADPCSAKK